MITFTRNTDGTFQKVDNWPRGRKLAQIQIGDARPWGKKTLSEALEVVETAIAANKAPAASYTIIPLKSDPMPPAVRELFGKTRAEKTVKYNSCQFSGCDETYPRNKGRYQNRFCPNHRGKEAEPPVKPPVAETELE